MGKIQIYGGKPMHELVVAFDKMAFVHKIDYVKAPEPFVHQNRTIPHHILIYVKKGCINVCEDGIPYKIREHEIFFLKAGVHHWGNEETKAGTEWFYVHFHLDEPALQQDMPDVYVRFLRDQEFSLEDYHHQVVLPKQYSLNKHNPIRPKLEEMYSIFRSDSPFRSVDCSQLLVKLMLSVYEHASNRTGMGKQDMLTRKLIDYLQDHLTGSLPSGKIAAYMEMNYRYLCDVFKKKTGMTIHQYHTRLRITESMRLLRESTLNISQVAERVDYQDPLYFSTVFKRITGISPTEYLRQTYKNDV